MSLTLPDLRLPVEVQVSASARIHVTLIDMNGTRGRVDGSVGFAVRDPCLRIAVSRRPGGPVVHADSESTRQRVANELVRAAQALDVKPDLDVRVESMIPAHQGLGSGTQLRLALLQAVGTLHGRPFSPADLGRAAGRGGTSGIGIHCFAAGGIVIDGGHTVASKPAFLPSRFAEGAPIPPVLFAHPAPPEWSVVLAMPERAGGLEGAAERDFMIANTPVPLAEVQAVSHTVLMGLMPAVVERDLTAFGQALTTLQDVGWKRCHWARPELAPWRSLVDVVVAAGAGGAGLSSTGPLVYGVFDSSLIDAATMAERVSQAAHKRGLPLQWVRTTPFGESANISTRGAFA